MLHAGRGHRNVLFKRYTAPGDIPHDGIFSGRAWSENDLFSREVNGGTKMFNLYVWPVRGGR
jgi:hypothetical protein